jgi:acyl-CoA reductase-like NAD-dependent aldehyde dehydrogenase
LVGVPVGPVAAFTPWNFPINQIVRKLSAALATGCSIIVKAVSAHQRAPQSVFALSEIGRLAYGSARQRDVNMLHLAQFIDEILRAGT